MLHGYVVIQKKRGGNGPFYPVNASIKIGRGTHCGIRVHLQSVSEEHSLICVEKGKRAQIQNLSTSSVTLVNGVSVGNKVIGLHHGDLVTVGERAFLWMYPENSQFFKSNNVSSKRRKSIQTLGSASPRIAVVSPLHHKRHTLGAPIAAGSPLRTPKYNKSQNFKEMKNLKEDNDLKSKQLRVTPQTVKSPNKRTSRTPQTNSTALRASGKSSASKNSTATPSVKSNASARVSRSHTPKTAVLGEEKSALSLKKTIGAKKRRLSSPSASVAKRMKIESPKTIDKKKKAALISIHRKSPWVAASPSHKSKVASLSSKIGKRSITPFKGQQKTPGSVQKASVWGVLGSSTKAKRPLFSEVLKRAKQRVITGKRGVVPVNSKIAAKKRPVKVQLVEDIPKSFRFNTARHANSPDPIFIGRKTTVTPVVTRKGRKEGCFPAQPSRSKDDDLSGLCSMFKTPGKNKHIKSPDVSSDKSDALEVGSPKILSQNSEEKESKPLTQTKLVLSKSSGRDFLSTKHKFSTPPPRQQRSSETLVSSTRTRSLGSSCQLLSTVPSTGYHANGEKSPKINEDLQKQKRTPLVLKGTPNVGIKCLSVLVTPSGSTTRSKSTDSGRKSSAKASATSKSSPGLTSTPAASHNHGPNVVTIKSSPRRGSSVQVSRSPSSAQKPPVKTLHSPQLTPVKSSMKSLSPNSGSPARSKPLSVSFDDSVDVLSVELDLGTPDMTFDFNSVKTPNVPSEMFVSSIFSSGSSCSGYAAGSAKRKGKSSKSSPSSGLRGVRRLMKTPASPAGYVDVRGIKRLMASPIKTPTYLAVEGVKKLFGDAASSSNNRLSSFVGVKELFASPSPSKARSSGKPQVRSPEVSVDIKASPVASPSPSKARSSGGKAPVRSPEVAANSKPSPVAKIVAEVEGKMTPNFNCAKTSRTLSPENATSSRKNARSSLRNSDVSHVVSDSPIKTTNVQSRIVSKTDLSPQKIAVENSQKVSSLRGRRKKGIDSVAVTDTGSVEERLTRRRAQKVTSPVKRKDLSPLKTSAAVSKTSLAAKAKNIEENLKSPRKSVDTAKSSLSVAASKGKRKQTSSIKSKVSPAKRAKHTEKSSQDSSTVSSNSPAVEHVKKGKKAVGEASDSFSNGKLVTPPRNLRRRGVKVSSPAQTISVEIPSKRQTKRKKEEPTTILDSDVQESERSVRSTRGGKKATVNQVISPVKTTRSGRSKNPRNSPSSTTPSKTKKVTFSQEEALPKTKKRVASDSPEVEKRLKQSCHQDSSDSPVNSPPKARRGRKQPSRQSPTKAKPSVAKSKNVREKSKSVALSPRKTRSAKK